MGWFRRRRKPDWYLSRDGWPCGCAWRKLPQIWDAAFNVITPLDEWCPWHAALVRSLGMVEQHYGYVDERTLDGLLEGDPLRFPLGVVA